MPLEQTDSGITQKGTGKPPMQGKGVSERKRVPTSMRRRGPLDVLRVTKLGFNSMAKTRKKELLTGKRKPWKICPKGARSRKLQSAMQKGSDVSEEKQQGKSTPQALGSSTRVDDQKRNCGEMPGRKNRRSN